MQALRCCFLGKTGMRPILLQRMFQGYQAGNCIERKSLRYLWKHVFGLSAFQILPYLQKRGNVGGSSSKQRKAEKRNDSKTWKYRYLPELWSRLHCCFWIAALLPRMFQNCCSGQYPKSQTRIYVGKSIRKGGAKKRKAKYAPDMRYMRKGI